MKTDSKQNKNLKDFASLKDKCDFIFVFRVEVKVYLNYSNIENKLIKHLIFYQNYKENYDQSTGRSE